mmetsp:Transcript_17336/g.48040  ORF Transcript_17336/g.48040 Transcript_17336/m.48040 type:complete len:352 (+) Transcript_17336:157-1212(+)
MDTCKTDNSERREICARRLIYLPPGHRLCGLLCSVHSHLQSFLWVGQGGVEDSARCTLSQNVLRIRAVGIEPCLALLAELLVELILRLRHQLLVILRVLHGVQVGEFERVVGGFRDEGNLLRRQGSLLLGRCAGPELAAWDFRSRRDERSGCDDAVGFDDGTIHYLCRLADHDEVLDRAGMDDCAGSDGDVAADEGGMVSLYFGDMDHGTVTDVGFRSDGDLIDVSADGGTVPDTGMLSDGNISNDRRRRSNEVVGTRNDGSNAINRNKPCGWDQPLCVFCDFDLLAEAFHCRTSLAQCAGSRNNNACADGRHLPVLWWVSCSDDRCFATTSRTTRGSCLPLFVSKRRSAG